LLVHLLALVFNRSSTWRITNMEDMEDNNQVNIGGFIGSNNIKDGGRTYTDVKRGDKYTGDCFWD
jgi:hypothetical protein